MNCFGKSLSFQIANDTGFKWSSPCIMCVQYRGGCSVPWGVFSTVGGYLEYRGGYHEYRGGIS